MADAEDELRHARAAGDPRAIEAAQDRLEAERHEAETAQRRAAVERQEADAAAVAAAAEKAQQAVSSLRRARARPQGAPIAGRPGQPARWLRGEDLAAYRVEEQSAAQRAVLMRLGADSLCLWLWLSLCVVGVCACVCVCGSDSDSVAVSDSGSGAGSIANDDPSLTSLDWSKTDLHDGIVQRLGNALRGNTHLRQLDLRFNPGFTDLACSWGRPGSAAASSFQRALGHSCVRTAPLQRAAAY